jgi:hypothetical protein
MEMTWDAAMTTTTTQRVHGTESEQRFDDASTSGLSLGRELGGLCCGVTESG